MKDGVTAAHTEEIVANSIKARLSVKLFAPITTEESVLAMATTVDVLSTLDIPPRLACQAAAVSANEQLTASVPETFPVAVQVVDVPDEPPPPQPASIKVEIAAIPIANSVALPSALRNCMFFSLD
jgi:hypothetical protein